VKDSTFEFSAPIKSSVSSRRGSEIVPVSELSRFKYGLNYLTPGVEIAPVWDYRATLMPLLRDVGLRNEIMVTRR
jgi:hypothetical protein